MRPPSDHPPASSAIPPALVSGLVEGPSALSGIEWHESVASTTPIAFAAARRGAPEVHAVLADEQTAGRGRLGRAWHAPPGTSLLVSFLLRPSVPPASLPLLPLLVGTALVDAVGPHCAGVDVTLKWPNDLLVGGRKAAGILVEGPVDGAVVVGVGVDVDWRGADRPPELGATTSLSEAAGRPVDRWRVFAALVGVLGNRYDAWARDPTGFLDDYRARCATLGADVRVEGHGGTVRSGRASAVDDGGRLVVVAADGAVTAVSSGDVVHVRASGP